MKGNERELMELGRYHRQEIFYPIGKEGQQKLRNARVCIIGVGALGAAIANDLARAGVGFLRLIDRDIVELPNLQRQVLFTEKDAEEMIPKAEAAKIHLEQANSDVDIEAMVVDVNPYNVEKLISGVDLVIDGLDNLETRYLLNDACQKNGYGDLPVCIAKTQYSFSDDMSLRGAPDGFTVHIKDVRLSAGAGFIVAFAGDIIAMPGMPKKPAALQVDVQADGTIEGLF